MFMTAKQASEKWGISDRRIRVLCSEGKIPGAYQEGRGWKIPVDAKKPADKWKLQIKGESFSTNRSKKGRVGWKKTFDSRRSGKA